MALDAAHRASIFEKLRPILGDEDANRLMSEFPSVEGHEPVTKDFLRAELALTKGELRSEISALETRLTVRLGSAIAASTALLLAGIGLLS